jgi:transcriptional regulator with GAF, ATPase, and Fis domain
MRTAWCCCLAPASIGREVGRALAQTGVSVHDLGSDPSSGTGLVVFDEVTPELLRVVADARGAGADRIVALAVAPLRTSDIWQLLEAGVAEVIAWDQPAGAAARIAARLARWDAIDALVDSPPVRGRLAGSSRLWNATVRQIVEAGGFTAAPVLILGESGTGKELAARVIHELDPRSGKQDLIVLDCAAIVTELSGSEFFGHERGAFTGALTARDGAFALANGGTLFLDEIGELPLPLQAQLLRVIQERVYKRVGGNTWRTTNFRLVCATNKDLRGAVERGEFRCDLYHRISGWTITLPPLSSRREDILTLADHFIRELLPDQQPTGFDPAVTEFLLNREYPGNIRELKLLVCRLLHRYAGCGPLAVGDIPDDERPHSRSAADEHPLFVNAVRRALAQGMTLKAIGRTFEDIAVSTALDAAAGNTQLAARTLGVSDRALQLRRAARRATEVSDHGDAA